MSSTPGFLEPLATLLLGLAGLTVAAAGFCGVRAAQKEIKALVTLAAALRPFPAGYPPLISAKHHKAGHALPYLLPLVTAAIWLCILAVLASQLA
jgi:hypothetical protein